MAQSTFHYQTFQLTADAIPPDPPPITKKSLLNQLCSVTAHVEGYQRTIRPCPELESWSVVAS